MNCVKCKADLPEDALFCHKCGQNQSKRPKKRRRKSSHGSGTVVKLSGNRKRPWAAYAEQECITKKRPFIGTFETEAEARDALRTLPGAASKGKYNYTVADVYERWKPAHFRALKSDKGREGYENAWNHLEAIHGIKMRDISKEELQGPIDMLAESGKSRSLCEKVQQLESQLCQWAIDNEIINQNHARKIELPLQKEVAKRPFTDGERERIRVMCNDNDWWEIARITLCWIYTGVRGSELLQIRSENVYPSKHFMIGGLKTVEGKNRIIPIHPKIQDFINEWYLLGSEWLIPSGNDTPLVLNNTRKKFKLFMEHLGIQGVETRTCRRTYATMLAQKKVRQEIVSKLMGHVDYDTTMIYILNNLDELLEPVFTSVSARCECARF